MGVVIHKKDFKFAMESRRAVLSGNASLTATLSSDYIDFY